MALFIIAKNSMYKLTYRDFINISHDMDEKSISIIRGSGSGHLTTNWFSMTEDNNYGNFQRIKDAILKDRWWKRTIINI